MPFGSIEEGIASVLMQQGEALSTEVTPVYVPLLGKHFASDEAEAFDLETSVRQFMAVENQRRVLVLYGDAGSGKSSFFQSLTLSLLAEYTAENPIPLFISLPTLRDPVHRAVEETLENYGFSAEQIEGLKERHSFVFIFDGYDEIHQLQNLYMSNHLNTWQAKLLISCRSQYVYNKGNPDSYFMPLAGERGQPHLLSTLYTAAFNEEQIATYFALMRERGVVIPSDEELQIIPGLKALITTPFLLHMTIEVLPAILERYSAASSSDEYRRLKQMELYDAFITQWFLRQEAKLKTSGHITEAMPDKKSTFWRYAQALAVEMHKYDVTWVSPGDERFAVFFESEAETEMIRSACPLKKSGESFGFWHQSLSTYFTVRTMYEEECAQTTELTDTGVAAGAGAGAGSSAGASDSSISLLPSLTGIIHLRSITEDFSALKLFADQVDRRFKTRMFDIIDASKAGERYAFGAANAITILNWAGVMLINKNWRGIQIPGANLSYAVLSNSDLSYANLTRVKLFRAKLDNVNLSQANLHEIDFKEMKPIKIEKTAERFSKQAVEVLKEKSIGVIICHPTKPWIAIAAGLTIWQYDTEKNSWATEPMSEHRGPVTAIAYSHNGRLLASGSQDNTIRQWDTETSKPLGPVIMGHTKGVTSVAYAPNDCLLASGSIDGTVRQWYVETGEIFGLVLIGHEQIAEYVSPKYPLLVASPAEGVTSVAYSPDGKLLASGGADAVVCQWRVDTGELFGPPLIGHTAGVTSVAYSPDGKLLASGSKDHTVRQWVAEAGLPFGPVLSGHKDEINSIAYLPTNGSILASGSWDKTVRQWVVESGMPFGVVFTGGHDHAVYSIAYSADGTVLASAGFDQVVRRWKVEASEHFTPSLPGHTDHVMAIDFSPDGKLLASGSNDGTVRQWVIESGLPFGSVLVGHKNHVRSVTYSPNGKLLASAGYDGTVRQWVVATGLPFGPTLEGHRSPVFMEFVAYTSDGMILTSVPSAVTGRPALHWKVDTGEPCALPPGSELSIPDSGNDGFFRSKNQKYLAARNHHSITLWQLKEKPSIIGKVLDLLWISRSAADQLDVGGLILHNAIGLQKEQRLLLNYAYEYGGDEAIDMDVTSEYSMRHESLPVNTHVVSQVRSHMDQSLLISETQWYIHLLVMTGDEAKVSLSVEGLLLPTSVYSHIERDIYSSIEDGTLSVNSAYGLRSYLFCAEQVNINGINTIRTRSVVTPLAGQRTIELPEESMKTSWEITPDQADKLISFIQEDLRKQTEITISLTTPLLNNHLVAEYNADSLVWVIEKLARLGREANDPRFNNLLAKRHVPRPILVIGAYIGYAGMKIASTVIGAEILGATGYGSYQEMHQTVGIKIAATTVGFDVLLAGLALLLFDCLKGRYPGINSKLFLFLAYLGVMSISDVISTVIFDKNLVGQSIASLFLGKFVLLNALCVLGLAKKIIGNFCLTNDYNDNVAPDRNRQLAQGGLTHSEFFQASAPRLISTVSDAADENTIKQRRNGIFK